MPAVIVTGIVIALLAYPAAAAQLPDPDEPGDVVDDVAGAAGDAVEDTTGAVEDTVEDTTRAVEDTVEDTTRTVDDTVEDTTRTVEDAVEDTTRTTPSSPLPAAPGGAPGGASSTEPGGTGTTGGGTGTAATGGTGTTGGGTGTTGGGTGTAATGATGTTGGGTGTAATGATGGAAESLPTGSGDVSQQASGHTSSGGFGALNSPLAVVRPSRLAIVPDRVGAGAATSGTLADAHGPLVATVRFDDGRPPFVSQVMFERVGDTTLVQLHPTNGTPLAGPDDEGATTAGFRGLVLISGEEPFRADVRLIVRDDGLVLLVTPVTARSATGVLSRVLERLASTGLPLLPLGSLGLALLAVGALALRGSRNRRWEGPATAGRP